ncbi:hypothetical protein [Hungatella hathewayi]|uniref:hypothetical protein n=2 Tax=Hungatella hathewayi TaxID=154046 RepID=UPI00110AD6C3|nr:hypothetical protein [Hungatella hathewayi]MBS4985732.1 hypothetical protein [Hungatella hathewayi]
MKFFKKIGLETGYNALGGFNKFLMVLMWLLPIILGDVLKGNLMAAILFFIPFIILILRNLKMKKINYIIEVSILQLIISPFIFLLIIYKVYETWTGAGKKAAATAKVNYAEVSWSGNRIYDDNRARELGYSNVQEAINDGMAYNGVKIF